MSHAIGETLRKLADIVLKQSRGKELAGPWAIDIDHEGWVVATDLRLMLWVKMIDQDFPVCNDREVRERLLLYFNPPPCDNLQACPLGDLKRFTEAPQWTVPCPECDGKSKDNEYLHCSFCDCDGIRQAEVRPGILCGLKIDRERLARIIWPFQDDEEVEVQIGLKDIPGRTDRTPSVWVQGTTFRAVLVGMTPDMIDEHDPEVMAWKNAPVFGAAAVS